MSALREMMKLSEWTIRRLMSDVLQWITDHRCTLPPETGQAYAVATNGGT